MGGRLLPDRTKQRDCVSRNKRTDHFMWLTRGWYTGGRGHQDRTLTTNNRQYNT